MALTGLIKPVKVRVVANVPPHAPYRVTWLII